MAGCHSRCATMQPCHNANYPCCMDRQRCMDVRLYNTSRLKAPVGGGWRCAGDVAAGRLLPLDYSQRRRCAVPPQRPRRQRCSAAGRNAAHVALRTVSAEKVSSIHLDRNMAAHECISAASHPPCKWHWSVRSVGKNSIPVCCKSRYAILSKPVSKYTGLLPRIVDDLGVQGSSQCLKSMCVKYAGECNVMRSARLSVCSQRRLHGLRARFWP